MRSAGDAGSCVTGRSSRPDPCAHVGTRQVIVDSPHQRTLIRFMLLSLGAAIATILLKLSAAPAITGSVGFLSDAIESGVNLVARDRCPVFVAHSGSRPPDAVHHFGHGKAEYVSAVFEGAMIFVAASVIVWTSIERLIHRSLSNGPVSVSSFPPWLRQ